MLWSPIETAPRGWTSGWVLLTCGGLPFIGVVREDGTAGQLNAPHGPRMGGDLRPTHWMPLPANPEPGEP